MAVWNKIGSVRKGKKEGSKYIKVDADVTLKKGQNLQVQDPRKKLADSVASGRMSETEAEERAAKIPDYITAEVYLVEE